MGGKTFTAAVLALSLAIMLGLAAQGGAAAKPKADLSVSLLDNPDPVTVNSPLTYTTALENHGPDAVADVSVTIVVGSSARIGAIAASAGSCSRSKQKITCRIGAMPAPTVDYSGPPTVTVSVTPTRVGTLKASATVNGTRTDPASSNNRADATTTVAPPPVTCRGLPANIVGTGADDDLIGTPGPDVIAGFGGDDTIHSLSGRDLICAAGGSDLIFAGSAADRVYAGRGADVVNGGGGPDLLKGGPANDVLRGNRGSDRLFGGAGRRDVCRGGPGRNVIRSCER
jgi:Ca2+-binding RTX toxin-like protein